MRTITTIAKLECMFFGLIERFGMLFIGMPLFKYRLHNT